MQFDEKRREFITLLGGAAAAWPLAARAQQPAMPILGLLGSGEPPSRPFAAFRKALSEHGFVDGRNVAFQWRRAGSEYNRFPALADELVRLHVSAIFAYGGTAAALAAKAATSTIPVVFYVSGDPVASDLVASLNRPARNLTGLTFLSTALAAKRLELLGELVPKVSMTAMLVNPTNPDTDFETRDVQDAASVLRHDIRILQASQEPDFQAVFAALVEQHVSALLVASDAFFSNQRTRLVRLAQRHAIPTMYDRREFPEVGGLISYGHHRADAYHQLGVYVAQVLKGAHPSDLPVLQPTRFELVVNLKTANALSLRVPQTLLVAADEVIE